MSANNDFKTSEDGLKSLQNQIPTSENASIPKSYTHDEKVADLLKKMDKNRGGFKKAARPGYSQVYFPYNSNYINQIDVGKIKTLPTGGKTIYGKQTNASCAMNAARIYNEKNSPSLNSNYELGIRYQFTFVPVIPTGAPTSAPTGAPTGEPTVVPTGAPTSAPTSAPITKSGIYSKILPFPAEAPVVYPITIELTGMMLPSGGGKGKLKLDPKYSIGTKTIRVWLGMNSSMCTKYNAFIRYDNGVAKETKNSKSDVLFLKNTYMPIVVRYVANSEADVRFYSDNNNLPFIFVTNSNTVVDYSLYMSSESTKLGSPVYYNFQTEGSKCTVYDTRNKDVDANLLENRRNYGEYVVETIMAIKLNDAAEFVGLNELGVLMQYYLDPTVMLKSEPIKDMNGGKIEASNRGKGGINKKGKYEMVLYDNSNKKFKSNKNKFAFPIENAKMRGLVENKNWKRMMEKEKINLEYIDNSRQTTDRGILAPSMRITKTMPLFSKDYKLKIELKTVGGETHLIVKRTTRNPNSLVSVIPDFKIDKLFVADDNMGVNKMYLAKDDITKKYGWEKYDNYGPKQNSLYDISNRKGNGDCARKASAKSHFFVEKGKCYIPKVEESMNGYEFVPNKNSIMYVPSRALKENPDKYKHYSSATTKKGYANFDLAKDNWNNKLSLPNQNDFYNGVTNFTRRELGIIPKSNVEGTAAVMQTPRIDGFTDGTIQQRTQKQIQNRIDPLFNSYLNNQTDVNTNVKDIKANIASINRKYGVLSNTATETNSVKNHKFYDFTDEEIYSLQEDRSLVPALLKDQQTMIVEHNKLYVISTITVATLLISAIFVSSK